MKYAKSRLKKIENKCKSNVLLMSCAVIRVICSTKIEIYFLHLKVLA